MRGGGVSASGQESQALILIHYVRVCILVPIALARLYSANTSFRRTLDLSTAVFVQDAGSISSCLNGSSSRPHLVSTR